MGEEIVETLSAARLLFERRLAVPVERRPQDSFFGQLVQAAKELDLYQLLKSADESLSAPVLESNQA